MNRSVPGFYEDGMGLEIEAKMKVGDFDAIRAVLAQAGARKIGVALETNTFFDTPEKLLLKQDRGLRLRRAKDLASGEEHFIITVKGPAQAGLLKTREESEVRVASGDKTVEIFRQLGFEPELSFQKKRESWELGGCKIELDELPILGKFVEIEGPDPQTVMKVREQIKLDQLQPIKTGYISMLSRHLQETGDPRKSITF